MNYFDGRPDPGTRLDPNNQILKSGSQHWPFVPQPFRSWPNALALTPNGAKLYVTLPGREGYPDWRVASVDTASRRVLRWINLNVAGQPRGTRPVAIAVSPVNTAIFARPYAVVLNQYANFASVIDTGNDTVLGQFETDFYAEDLVFNAAGTRLYTTDRFKDQVRAFRIDPGPSFTQIAEIPTGTTDLDRSNPRDLSISADGSTLYAANTLGHTIAVIDIAGDANTLVRTMPVGGLATDVKVAGRWGIVSGHSTNSVLNQPETGPRAAEDRRTAQAIRNTGQPLGYTPVMSDATRATTFDDLGSELNVFDTATNQFVFRYVDFERDQSMLAVPGQLVDLADHAAAQEIIRGSGPEQLFVSGNLLFVSQLHSDKVEVFLINQNPASPSRHPDRARARVHRRHHAAGPRRLAGRPHRLRRQHADRGRVVPRRRRQRRTQPPGFPDRRRHRQHARSDQGRQRPEPVRDARRDRTALAVHRSRTPTTARSRAAIATGRAATTAGSGTSAATRSAARRSAPQNKDTSDNWPEWFEGLSSDMNSYLSSCNGELVGAERPTALFPQPALADRLRAREEFVLRKTEENSRAIGRPELSRQGVQDRLLRHGLPADPVDAERDAADAEPAAPGS